MTQRPTWFWPAVSVATALASVGAALAIRSIMNDREMSASLLKPTPKTAQEAWPQVSIESAMPDADEFPSGWSIQDTGHYEKKQDPESSRAAFTIQWRVLRLKSPTARCTPPCEWVAVWAGANSFGTVTFGWEPAKNSEQAIDIIADKIDEVE